MRFRDCGCFFNVSVSKREIRDFTKVWPCSGMRGVQYITFVYDKQSGDNINISHRGGNKNNWDGQAVSVLIVETRRYGQERLKKLNRTTR